jgi:hypothetical protein
MLFRTWRAANVSKYRLRELAQVGKQLSEALELAKAPLATSEHARAWQLAETATEELGRLVGSNERTLALVTEALRGLERRPPASVLSEREERRLARQKR